MIIDRDVFSAHLSLLLGTSACGNIPPGFIGVFNISTVHCASNLGFLKKSNL